MSGFTCRASLADVAAQISNGILYLGSWRSAPTTVKLGHVRQIKIHLCDRDASDRDLTNVRERERGCGR